MQATVEVRWFYKIVDQGVQIEDIVQRFKDRRLKGDRKQSDERIDIYLFIPGANYLGAKLRGNNGGAAKDKPDIFELKWRTSIDDCVNFAPEIEGRIEHWNKWSFTGKRNGDRLSKRVQDQNDIWIHVQKQRSICKYQINERKEVIMIPLHKNAEQGCSVELTLLHVYDQQWLTLGLETFGSASDQHVRLVAEHIFQESYTWPFQRSVSCSYPEWLQCLMIEKQPDSNCN